MGNDEIVRGITRTVKGADEIVRGITRTVKGADEIVRGLTRTVRGLMKLFELYGFRVTILLFSIKKNKLTKP